MKRKLDPRFNWTEEQIALEMLDWEHRSEDLQRLCDFVAVRLEEWLKPQGLRLAEICPASTLREQVVRAASKFTEKHTSLTLFVYLSMKEVIAELLAHRNKPPKP